MSQSGDRSVYSICGAGPARLPTIPKGLLPCSVWMAKGSKIGDSGGGSPEHPRQWLGARWAVLFPGSERRPEPPGPP
eukprot:scaffold51607_cov55-Phaeocystis_antarctica.AAC.2